MSTSHEEPGKALVPKLRFRGFSGPWRQRKLGEISEKINTGKSECINNEEGPFAILGSTSKIGTSNSFDYEGDFILTARVGANAGNLYRHSGKVKITDNTVFIQGDQINFLYYRLESFDLKKLSFGTGQPLVRASELKRVRLMIPDTTEERKQIGAFFHRLDALIAAQERKLDLLRQKKAYTTCRPSSPSNSASKDSPNLGGSVS